MPWTRLARVLLMAVVLLAQSSPPVEARPTPPEIPAPVEFVKSGSVTPWVAERVDVWTIGGGFYYWARSCDDDGFNPVTGQAYLKRMGVAANANESSFAVETLFSITCSNANQAYFTSLHAVDDAVFYAFSGTGGKRIQKRTVGDPTTAINLATFTGEVPKYRGITTTPGSLLFWVEQNGTTGSVEGVQRNTGSRQLTYNLGNVSVYEIGSIDGKVFFVHSGGTFRANYFCLAFGNSCVDVNQFGGPIFSMQFEGDGLSTPSANENIYYISGSNVWRTPNPRECGVSPTPSCQSFIQFTATSGHILSTFIRTTDPSTNTSRLFVKEYEKTSCPGINLWCRAFIRRDTAATTIVELGRSGQTGQGSLTENDVFGPLGVDTTFLVTDTPEGGQEVWPLGGLVFNDIDRLSMVKFSANSLDRDIAWRPFMEINQSVQNLNAGVTGNVPLVANRNTVVRVWPVSNGGRSLRSPYAVLEGRRNGALLPGSPLVPYIRPGAIAPGDPNPDRGTLNSGFVFDLPLSWTDGAVELRAILDPNQRIIDTNRGNNTLTATANFTRKTAVCLMFIPVRTTSAPTPLPSDPRVLASIDLMRRMWPVSEVRSFFQPEPVEELEIAPALIPPRLAKYGPYEFSDDGSKILTAISQREDLTDDPDECDDINAVTYYIGIIDGGMPPGGIISLGLGRTPGSALWINISNSGIPFRSVANVPISGQSLAHEMGHNAGRKHVLCPTTGDNIPANPDNSYPYPTCSIGPAGFSSNYGFDYPTDTILAPTMTGDLMSYAPAPSNLWPSDYTYSALFGAIANRASLRSMGRQAVDPNTLVVSASGTVSPGAGTATVEPFLVLPAGPADSKLQERMAQAAVPSASPYRIRLLDAGGAEISSQQFTPSDGAEGLSGTLAFSTVFPAPSGTIASIQILNGTTVLLTRTVGPASPVVSLSAPVVGSSVPGSLNVAWSAADADPGDYLVHTLQFSADGGQHWQTVFANVPGATPNGAFSYVVPAGTLPATTGATGVLRILTSDGFHTTIASVGSLTVAPSPPTVSIAQPNGGQPLMAGKDVKLIAKAQGTAGSTIVSYAWTVDGVARGTTEMVTVAGLTTGSHTAQVTVTDNKGLTGTALLTFFVDPLQIPIGSGSIPATDGFCDDSGYAGALQLQLDTSTGGQGIVTLIRIGNNLHACFTGLALGAAGSPPLASLHLDTGTAASPSDVTFSVSRTNTASSTTGGARGNAVPTGAGVLVAKSALGDTSASWSAEMVIDIVSLGGWDNLRSIRLAETGIVTTNDYQSWPYGIATTDPNNWAALNAEGADLGVTLTAGTASPTAGAPFAYTVSVSNAGPKVATSTLITLTLPSDMTGVTTAPSQGTCTVVGDQARCTIPSFAAGQSANIVVAGTLSGVPGSAVSASVSVSSSLFDTNQGNNTASVSGAIYTPPPTRVLDSTPDPGQIFRVLVPLGLVQPSYP